jgi:hypothetical protein
MSQEKLELAARWYEPWTSSKPEVLTAMPRIMEFCHPEIEWISRENGWILGVAGLEDPPADGELSAEGGEGLGLPPPAWIAPSRSQTSVSGRAPSCSRQRFMPQRRSPICFEKTSAPAAARE